MKNKLFQFLIVTLFAASFAGCLFNIATGEGNLELEIIFACIFAAGLVANIHQWY